MMSRLDIVFLNLFRWVRAEVVRQPPVQHRSTQTRILKIGRQECRIDVFGPPICCAHVPQRVESRQVFCHLASTFGLPINCLPHQGTETLRPRDTARRVASSQRRQKVAMQGIGGTRR